MAFLTIRIKGAEGYTRTALGKDRMIVGRASAADVPIKHTSISREHCALVRDGERWKVEDLGSSNGTWVGRAKVAGSQLLEDRAIIKIGHARLTFHLGDMATAKAEDKAEEAEGDGDGDAADTGEKRKRGAHDPLEAIPCSACGTWFSIAHRLSGETMPCPRCGQSATIPVLT
jgi:predicted component of type VI protein secretion system